MMHRMRITAADAKRLVRQAELLCPRTAMSGAEIELKLPAVRDAMEAGAIGAVHVDRIAKVIDLVPGEFVDKADAELAAAARQFGPTELSKVGQKLVDVLDPDGPEPADSTVVEARNECDIRRHQDGTVSGWFRMGEETAAHLLPMMSPLTKPQQGDDRTLVERQGDALAEIVRFAANSGQAPMEGGERPHIAVTIQHETLQTKIGKATLDNGHTLTPEQARRLACDAGIIPIVLGSKSQPIDIGESRRTADLRLRRALAIRDKGCAGPECDRPPSQCQAHHVIHWADGGPTTLDNMVLVCHFHRVSRMRLRGPDVEARVA